MHRLQAADWPVVSEVGRVERMVRALRKNGVNPIWTNLALFLEHR